MELREVEDFIYNESFDFGDIMSGMPIKQLKGWIEGYKKTDKKKTFEEYVEENSWMVCDTSYTMACNYSVYYVDQNRRYFMNKNKLDYKFVRKLFEPIFLKQFVVEREGGKKAYLTTHLKQWIRTYIGHNVEFFDAIVDNIKYYEEPDCYETLLAMFINKMGSPRNYFKIAGMAIPSLDDAEVLVASYIDCSDPRIPLGQKWGYISQSNGLRSYMIRRILYEMLVGMDKGAGKNIRELVRMKDKKLKIDTIKSRLTPPEQLRFCITWQQITGQ